MKNKEKNKKAIIEDVVNELLNNINDVDMNISNEDSLYMPSPHLLKKVIDKLCFIFFPGYFNDSGKEQFKSSFSISTAIENIYFILYDQLSSGLSYSCQYKNPSDACRAEADSIIKKFILKLPEIKKLLIKDVLASYEGDPSAKSYGEVIFSYPSIRALINYRVAHQLFLMKVPMIPRIMTELAHSETGIDIHPGAKIGESFFMDHGTGIVIGETAIIGNGVRIYQGVTLGARSFSRHKDGTLIKGNPRHPIIGDNVVIYSGTTILGRIKIGDRAIIGGNLWVTESVDKGIKLVQTKPKEGYYSNGEGI